MVKVTLVGLIRWIVAELSSRVKSINPCP